MTHDVSLCRYYLAAMEILAKPWSGMLIAVLAEGPRRFNELAASVPQIADRMLALRLKELESRGLVRRTVDHGPPVRVSYALTAAGSGFREVVEAMSRWGRLLVAAENAVAAGGKAPGPVRPRAKEPKVAERVLLHRTARGDGRSRRVATRHRAN